MIEHLVHYYNDGFYYTWEMQLPFRLNKGDNLHNELLDAKGKLIDGGKETDEWITHCVNNEHFEIESIDIDHNGIVVAWLRLPLIASTK